jgi:uncharacterized protein (TIGR03083 family)
MVALERRLRQQRLLPEGVTAMSHADAREAARIYRESRERVAALVTVLDEASLGTPVAACPGWTVRDVVAHLAAVAEDIGDGRLTGPPSDEETADQVARFSGMALDQVLAAWSTAAEQLDRLAEIAGREPPVGDVASHEHDLRAAIGRPGTRDSEAVRYSSDRLLTNLRTPVPLRVVVEDAEYRSGPDDGPELRLRTTRFEALRWRTGRRSRAQLAAMDWSADPSPVLDHLYMFGPAERDLVE